MRNFLWPAVVVGGFGAGVFWRSFIDLGFSFSVFVIVVAVALFLLSRQRGRPWIVFGISLFVGFAGIGMMRFDLADARVPLSLEASVGDEVRLVGMVAREPDQSGGTTKLIVRAEALIHEAKSTVAGNVYISVTPYPRYEYGDRLIIEGELKKPENFAEGFDWVAYLAKENIRYQMFQPQVELLSKGQGNVIVSTLFRLKQTLLLSIRRALPEPHASLAGGLILGAKEDLGDPLLDRFRIAGIIHIVVLSGYNLTIIADTVLSLLRFLGRRISMSLGAIGIVLFAIMVGGGATVVRATIMAIIVLLARSTGRVYEATWALVLAGLMMVAWNPRVLVFDVGFQLSFVATLGLLFLQPIITRKLVLLPNWKYLPVRDVVSTTLAAQIAVFPLILYYMGDISLVALPVNFLILPLIPYTMLAAFLVAVLGLVSSMLAFPFTSIAYVLLAFSLGVVYFFSSLPLTSLHINAVSFWIVPTSYSLLLLLFLYSERPSPGPGDDYAIVVVE